jgi:hypothetical protein
MDNKVPESKLTQRQVHKYGPKVYTEGGTTYRITAKVRYDDDCGNGHNSFAITADIERKAGNHRWYESGGGCCHEEVAKHFPELAPFIKWHLTSSDGPMHYVANTLYFAGERDCYGKLKGEPKSWEKKISFESFPVSFKFEKKFIAWIEAHRNYAACPGFIPLKVEHEDKGGYKYQSKYTFEGYNCEWYECPFDTKQEAEEFAAAFRLPFSITETVTGWGEGKAPELEAARSSAIWPEATLEQLQSKELLEARLPALMAEFKRDVESLGFIY